MTEHPLPPPLPKKRLGRFRKMADVTQPAKPRKGSALFTSSIAIFVTAAAVCYIIVALAGVNVPRYYPTLRSFSFDDLAAQQSALISMRLYGRILFTLAGATVVTIGHLVLRPLFGRVKLIKTGYLTVFATVSIWFAASIIVVEEWHAWGIEKAEVQVSGIVNDALYLAGIGVLVFFGGILLTAFAVKRVAAIGRAKTQRDVSRPQGKATSNGL